MTTSDRTDRTSELVVDTHDLGRRSGAMREVNTTVSAPESLGSSMIAVAPTSPIRLDLRMEAVTEGVLVTGIVAATLTGECSRCLTEISQAVEVDVQELYMYPDKADPHDEDASVMEGELIDLEPLVRDEVLLDLPFMPLCRPDCSGLCPECGVDLNDDPQHEHAANTDPRWAALASWRSDADGPGDQPTG